MRRLLSFVSIFLVCFSLTSAKSKYVGCCSLSHLFASHSPKCVKVSAEVADKQQVASGFFVSEFGHVLTTLVHGSNYSVETNLHQKIAAHLLGEDSVLGVALIQVNDATKGVKFPYFSLSTSLPWPKIGKSVVSLSCKLGQSVSPQRGYVTSFNDRYFDCVFPLTLVRSSLAIDAGDCGGVVIDTKGNVLGMLSHALDDTKETFYIPTWALNKIFQDLLLWQRVRYSYVGLNTEVVYDKDRKRTCLRVLLVQPNSPAENCGILKDDILLKINEEDIDSMENFKNFMFLSSPGEHMLFTFLRNNKEFKCSLKTVEKKIQ